MPSSARPPAIEIYPLSLHDALPILPLLPRFSVLRMPTAQRLNCSCASRQSRTSPVPVPANTFPAGVAMRTRLLTSPPWRMSLPSLGDRKSTRLNSSHLGISYAVFCSSAGHRDLPSFPTRRSSDLAVVAEVLGAQDADGPAVELLMRV